MGNKFARYIYVIIAALLIVFMFSSSAYLVHKNNYQQEPKSIPVVKLHSEPGIASAVHVGGGYFLTAAHVFSDTETTLSLQTSSDDYISAIVVWISKDYDIAFLHADLDASISIDYYEIDCNPLNIGDELVLMGNPKHIDFARSWARVSSDKMENVSIWERIVVVNGTIIPGMSGGAAIDNRNKLRGINVGLLTHQTGSSMMGPVRSLTNFSYIVSGDDICFLMGRS